jgi:hypothetical protein
LFQELGFFKWSSPKFHKLQIREFGFSAQWSSPHLPYQNWNCVWCVVDTSRNFFYEVVSRQKEQWAMKSVLLLLLFTNLSHLSVICFVLFAVAFRCLARTVPQSWYHKQKESCNVVNTLILLKLFTTASPAMLLLWYSSSCYHWESCHQVVHNPKSWNFDETHQACSQQKGVEFRG